MRLELNWCLFVLYEVIMLENTSILHLLILCHNMILLTHLHFLMYQMKMALLNIKMNISSRLLPDYWQEGSLNISRMILFLRPLILSIVYFCQFLMIVFCIHWCIHLLRNFLYHLIYFVVFAFYMTIHPIFKLDPRALTCTF